MTIVGGPMNVAGGHWGSVKIIAVQWGSKGVIGAQERSMEVSWRSLGVIIT